MIILLNPTISDIWSSPRLILAFGFGSGCSPVVPGTVGTIAAIPFWYLASDFSLSSYIVSVYVAAVIGCYVCSYAEKKVGESDHKGIVWDEFVGFWITMSTAPVSWSGLVIGFCLFRVLDIVKPWPISWIDRNIHGGIGIMLDDVVAGIFAALLIWLLRAIHFL
jgi:phosphatidylglycerophosphatase A|tara:strand:- start:3056 stop:3547 length:492 start_codon:yes stop_codon:yes gene_type:complete